MFIYEGGVFMNKIKVFSLGGLNENGKNLYVVEINGRILLFDAGLKYANEKCQEQIMLYLTLVI